MTKNYCNWMKVKAESHNAENRPQAFKVRDIWIASIGENIGYEEDGKGTEFARPVLILKTYGKNVCHVVPLSTTPKRGIFYYPFDGHTGVVSVALLSQSRTIDSARLKRKIGAADEKDFECVKERIRNLLGF